MDAGLAGGPIVLVPGPVEEVWSPGDGGATIPGTYRGLPRREGGYTPFSRCICSHGHLSPPFCFVGISRPAFGGRPCVGEDLQAKMCNTQVGWSPSWEADRS